MSSDGSDWQEWPGLGVSIVITGEPSLTELASAADAAAGTDLVLFLPVTVRLEHFSPNVDSFATTMASY